MEGLENDYLRKKEELDRDIHTKMYEKDSSSLDDAKSNLTLEIEVNDAILNKIIDPSWLQLFFIPNLKHYSSQS